MIYFPPPIPPRQSQIPSIIADNLFYNNKITVLSFVVTSGFWSDEQARMPKKHAESIKKSIEYGA
jgi:hypothetical protein